MNLDHLTAERLGRLDVLLSVVVMHGRPGRTYATRGGLFKYSSYKSERFDCFVIIEAF